MLAAAAQGAKCSTAYKTLQPQHQTLSVAQQPASQQASHVYRAKLQQTVRPSTADLLALTKVVVHQHHF
jgi:hypothetical protein